LSGNITAERDGYDGVAELIFEPFQREASAVGFQLAKSNIRRLEAYATMNSQPALNLL
jgi:hypothetical protein